MDSNKLNNIKRQSESKVRNEILGVFKRVATDSFIKYFGENYGDSFDYNSLIHSLKFDIRRSKNGFSPNVSCNENNVEFKSDYKKECREFNENSRKDFISNDDVIQGDIDYYDFRNSEEFVAYKDSEQEYSDIQQLDDSFVPTSNGERYVEFNRINKQLGYSSVGDTTKQAMTELSKNWKKIETEIVPSILKKSGWIEEE